MQEVLLTDNHTAESANIFSIKPNHIYIADAGYGKGVNIEHIVASNAHAIFRATPNHLKLTHDKKGKMAIDMENILESSKKELVEINCYVRGTNKNHENIRIIASRLPEDKALMAQEKKLRKALKNSSEIKPKTLVYAKWVIIITTLGSDYAARSLLELYRNRWQIELTFKRIKQFFKIKKLRAASLKYS